MILVFFAKATLLLGFAAEWALMANGECLVALLWVPALMTLAHLIAVRTRRVGRGDRGS